MKQKQDLVQLFRKYLANQCSQEEVDELFELLEKEDKEGLKEGLISRQLMNNVESGNTDPFLQQKLDQSLIRILLKIDKPETLTRSILSLRLKWVAAAAILILLTTFIYLIISNQSKPVEVAKKLEIKDIPAPSSIRAKLRLDDGTIVYLDSAKNGSLAIQGHVKIMKTADGLLTYQGTSDKVMYNTMTNPRGSKIVNIILADGTKVWLNSESFLRYPTVFKGKERKVEISGEGYFEVAHNARMPFVVTKGEMEIKVLGTHFNVNTYDDQLPLSVTLLEGSVKVSSKGKYSMLTPGQQARLDGSAIKVVDEVDTEEVIAWKNGRFQFGEKTGIEIIMKQLSRWYNVEVEYRGKVQQHFWGSISRDVNVSQVLHKMESTGGVKFNIEGNKVIVMP